MNDNTFCKDDEPETEVFAGCRIDAYSFGSRERNAICLLPTLRLFIILYKNNI